MYVRLTFLNLLPGKAEEAKRNYNHELVPVVKQQKGNLDCKLLEPIDKANDYVSMTTWESKEDSDAYQVSGVYTQLVNRIRELYAKDPVLKVYSTQNVLEPA
jgi:heme-degrading monooxygenase HmoA